MIKKTQILTAEDIPIAAEIIRSGGTVVFPTETVYGLGANALDPDAAAKIFEAKGRPSDNPLIVHIPSAQDIARYAIPNDAALYLAELFMPGSLSLILPKRECIPAITSGGLLSVALRCPANPIALELLTQCNLPVAAPSANLSGSPSPTSIAHVIEDMDGRVDAIIDGGDCEVGVESTVLSLLGETPTILRPGSVTLEMLREALGDGGVTISKHLLEQSAGSEPVLSPGMKYRHYAPNAPLILVEGRDVPAYFAEKITSENCGILCWDEDLPYLRQKTSDMHNIKSMGSSASPHRQAHELFAALRDFNRTDIDRIYARVPSSEGVGLAVLNRLLRASGFNKITID